MSDGKELAGLPAAVWEGTFRLFGVDIRCYVLDDGQRIVNAGDINAAFSANARGAEETQEAIEKFAAWVKGEASEA